MVAFEMGDAALASLDIILPVEGWNLVCFHSIKEYVFVVSELQALICIL